MEGGQRKIRSLKLNDLDRIWPPVQEGGRTPVERGHREILESLLSILPPRWPRGERKTQGNSPGQIELIEAGKGRAEKERKEKRPWSPYLIKIIA